VTEGRLPPLIVIAGATATGKTGLSLGLAERISGAEIVSADSRQVYRGMDIGTAKVGREERARIAHHGLDLVDPDEAFTAGDFRRHALEALAGIAARGRVAILVGGTGLYLRVVARDVPIEETGSDPDLRAALEARLATEGVAALAAELRVRAPGIAAATDLANPRRVVRALERATLVGDRPPPAPRGYPGRVLWLELVADPRVHATWIAGRAHAQFGAGLLDEAAALRARYGESPRAFDAMGYREAFAVLDGRATLEEAIDRDVRRTRAYAKRQCTWLRSEPDLCPIEAGEGATARAWAIAEPWLAGLGREEQSPGSASPVSGRGDSLGTRSAGGAIRGP
jgi:tRNA dimethylallyltransferase